MEDKDLRYLDSFEASLLEEMLRFCTSLGMLDGELLESEDIDAKWKEFAPEYMADAVPNINDFPEAAIGWAGYVGLAVAKWWDGDWSKHRNARYGSLHGSRGFDDMDEHIVGDILGLAPGSAEAGMIGKVMFSCAQMAIGRIRHENVESQTALAFHVFARAVRAMFKIGAAIGLRRAGYKFVKIPYIHTSGGYRQ